MESKEKLYLTGQLLLAMPNMGDPRFHRAVIFMCAHDANGAMGIVINNTVPGVRFAQLLDQLNIDPQVQLSEKILMLPVLSGGPVETARGFLLHSSDFRRPDSVTIDDIFCVTGTVDALKAIARGEGPQDMIFALGYAGWGAGQLDAEIQNNAWLTAPATPELIFSTAPEDMWDKAIAGLGVDPGLLSAEAGRA